MNERSLAAIALVLAAYLCFAGLGTRSLENKDITRTAEIARETLESGRWLAPTREGELETEKPPLYIWLVAALGKATGKVGALESRLPAAAASFGSVLFIYFWIKKRRDVKVAVVAAAFLATGQVFLELARISRVDSVFAFLLLVSVVLAYEAEKQKLGRQLLLCALSGAALAGAMLAKSPLLAVVLHLASVGGWYIVDLIGEQPWRELREPAARTIIRRFLQPAASFPPIFACLLFSAWLFPFKASITPAEWDAVRNQFRFENTERAVTGSDKPQPFLFYVPVVLFRAAPGSLFALISLGGTFLAWTDLSLRYWTEHEEADKPLHRFAQSWWFFPFLVLSIASGKQGRYVLPCLPGLAVAGALNWRFIASSEAPWVQKLESGLSSILVALGAIAAVGMPVASALWLPEVLGGAICLAVVCAVVVMLAWRALRVRGVVVPLLLAVFVAEAGWNVVILPTPSYERPRVVVKKLAERLPQDLYLQDLVLFQVPKQGDKGESRQRRLRILLSIYRDDGDERNKVVPLVAATPEQLLEELAPPARRGLVNSANWEGLASITSRLEVVDSFPLEVEHGEDRFRLVKRR